MFTAINSRRARPGVRRQVPADQARSQIIGVEEERLQADKRRNEILEGIQGAIVELCTLVREYIMK